MHYMLDLLSHRNLKNERSEGIDLTQSDFTIELLGIL